MVKRRYSRNHIKILALQAASRAISNREAIQAYIDPDFLCDTSYNSPTRDGYPYMTELNMEFIYLSESIRRRIAKLSENL